MQSVGNNLLAILQSSERDLVDLFEFYSPAVTTLTPPNASKLFAPSTIVWNGNTYEQQAINRGDISRFIDEKFNNVTVTLSNIDRSVGAWLAGVSLDGWRLVIRTISRSVDNDSLVLFVGRCEKAQTIDQETASIVVKQDLGSLSNLFPYRNFSFQCQVSDGFKGAECLAGELVSTKNATYQAATACDFSHRQCDEYGNTDAIQAFRIISIAGTFRLKSQSTFKRAFRVRGRRRWWTSQNNVPLGEPVPLGFGRTQIELIPILHADTGEYIAGVSVIGEGEIAAIENLRNESEGFSETWQNLATHLGKYGTDPAQAQTGFFSANGDTYSRTAYAEYVIKGKNPDTGDPAPTIVAVILWQKIPRWNGVAFTGAEWSDNPVEILRQMMVDPRGLNYNSAWIDDAIAGATAEYCNEPLIDDSNSELVYLTNEITAEAGIYLKRYPSTGIINRYHFRKLLGLDSLYSQQREAAYNFFNPAAAPDESSISVTRFYRRRWTCNFHLDEHEKASDFIFKRLLPCFHGYLTTSATGKLQIKSERPQLTQILKANASGGALSLAIEDAAAWKALSLPVLYALVGVGLNTSETVKVNSIDYSTAGNSITLTTSVSGSVTATASSATLSGGSTTTQAIGTVTIGGTISAGNTVTVTIDGTAIQYSISSDDTTGTIAAMLATMINANPTLKRFVKAEWSTASATVITIKSKLGTLNLSSGLLAAHNGGEEIMHIHLPFADRAFGILSRANIIRKSFDWPLGNRETNHNQFTIIFSEAVQDFGETELRQNDYDHQKLINKVNKKEIDGTCVDNFFQADLLVRMQRAKYRDNQIFTSFEGSGISLLLEEGDRVCVDHTIMPLNRNLPVTLEEVKVTPDHRVKIVGRKYSKSQFPETGGQATVKLITGITWPTTAPDTPTNLVLTQPTPGTVRGVFDFAIYQGKQTARVEVKKPGSGSFVDTGIRVAPDSTNKGTFELAGISSGTTEFKVFVFNDLNKESSALTGSITVSNPLAPRLEPGVISLTATLHNPTVT